MLDPCGDWPTWLATSPFVPEEERADYLEPEFLKKTTALETLDWLPKLQAKKNSGFNNYYYPRVDTPKPIKEKIRAAVPAGTTVTLYQTLPEFTAAFPNSTNLQCVEHELRSQQESQ